MNTISLLSQIEYRLGNFASFEMLYGFPGCIDA